MKTAVASIDKRLVLAALSFGLTLTTWADDFDMKSSFDEPVTQTLRFGIVPFFGYNGIAVASFSGSTLWQGQVSLGVGSTF